MRFVGQAKLKEGQYTFKVEDVIERETPRGNQSFRFVLRDTKDGLVFNHDIVYVEPNNDSQGTAFLFIKLFEACGIPPTSTEGGSSVYECEPSVVIDKEFSASLIPDPKNPDYLKIDLKSMKTAISTSGGEQIDDDLPF